MCFSATASFIAGAALGTVGLASIRKALRPQELFFASIPLIFAAQQVVEGLLWLTFSKAVYRGIQTDLTYMYLFIAEVLWPVWVPLSLLLMEKKGMRRVALYIVFITGIAVSAYLCFHLLTFEVHADSVNGHIRYYERYRPAFITLGNAPYLLVTILPFFISRVPYTSLIGIAAVSIYLLGRLLFFEQFLTSVWCFYAAVVSSLVYLIIHWAHRERKRDK